MESNPLVFIIRTLGELYIFILLLRFLLQVVKADYYNPICQGVVSATKPVLAPLQKILPKILNIDISPLVFAFVAKAIVLYVAYAIGNQIIPLPMLSVYASLGVLNTFLDVIFYAMVGSIIISWIAPDSPHPAPQLIMQVTAPIYKLVNKVLPPLGGFDLSPIVVILSIQLIQYQMRLFII
ncbi:MAG: hypothetical protein OFPII_29340 [Osedax symbiont Rs1]|nr:MAG: hypothetical protein OFPII_29340 [Osedax symbiont Rs1]